MSWSTVGMFLAGGGWTLIVLLVGVGLGRHPYVTPLDPRGLTK